MCNIFDTDPSIAVLDCGTFSTKSGFASIESPQSIIPSIIGLPNAEFVGSIAQKKSFIGNEAAQRSQSMPVEEIFAYGSYRKAEWLEALYHHLFYNELVVAPEDTPVLVTEPAMVQPRKAKREKIFELLFERFRVPGAYLAAGELLSLFSLGRETGMVVDVGYDFSRVVPAYECYTLPHATRICENGGFQIRKQLKKLLNNNSICSSNNTLDDIMKQCCLVSNQFELDKNKESDEFNQTYELPDGQSIIVGKERFLAPEVLFQPSLMNQEHGGLIEMFKQSLNLIDASIVDDLSSCVILSGGASMFPGFASRFETELNAQLPDCRFKVFARPERAISQWIGGSIFASLSTFQQLLVSQREYEEEGPSIVHKKCF